MFGTVDTGKGWHSQVCPRTIGGIYTCHKMRHSLSLPTVTYICMREFSHVHHGPTASFLHCQPIQTPPSGPGYICATGTLRTYHVFCTFCVSERSTSMFFSTVRYRSSSLLSFQQSNCSQIVPSQCLAQPMAMPLAVVRTWVEQAVFIMGQTSRCCMIPASLGRLLVLVGFRQPVLIRQVSFSVASRFISVQFSIAQ